MNELIVALDDPQAADPDRFGPKAANLAALARAGLPTPGGFCLDAEAYRIQLAALGLADKARRFATAELLEARRLAVEIRLGLYERPIDSRVLEPLLEAWRTIAAGGLGAVRSSALIEDRAGANFAGQFESFLGLDNEAVDGIVACRVVALHGDEGLQFRRAPQVHYGASLPVAGVSPLEVTLFQLLRFGIMPHGS